MQYHFIMKVVFVFNSEDKFLNYIPIKKALLEITELVYLGAMLSFCDEVNMRVLEPILKMNYTKWLFYYIIYTA